MSKVFTHMTMSLDGFIADPDDGIEDLFDWYGAGDVVVPSANVGDVGTAIGRAKEIADGKAVRR